MTTPIAGAVRLPPAARMAAWLPAALSGCVRVDEAVGRIVGEDPAHHLVPPEEAEPVSLLLGVGVLRSLSPKWTQLAWPTAGHPVGLAGPATFNAEALDAEGAVLLGGTGLGLVPASAGRGIVWRLLPANEPAPWDVGEADRELRAVLPRVADLLADLDVAAWSPDAADLLMNLRAPGGPELPPGTDGQQVSLLQRATRCVAIAELGLDRDGDASPWVDDRRRDALRTLARTARQAVAAACSTVR